MQFVGHGGSGGGGVVGDEDTGGKAKKSRRGGGTHGVIQTCSFSHSKMLQVCLCLDASLQSCSATTTLHIRGRTVNISVYNNVTSPPSFCHSGASCFAATAQYYTTKRKQTRSETISNEINTV